MVLLADAPLLGPSPRDVFDPIPRRDYVTALLSGVKGLLEDLDADTCNVLLTLARIWSGISTDKMLTKDQAARWVLDHSPARHHQVLSEAMAIYLGDREDWTPPLPEARAFSEYVVAEVRALARREALQAPTTLSR
jgi:streptomycin 3"-adenylyltransferase